MIETVKLTLYLACHRSNSRYRLAKAVPCRELPLIGKKTTVKNFFHRKPQETLQTLLNVGRPGLHFHPEISIKIAIRMHCSSRWSFFYNYLQN